MTAQEIIYVLELADDCWYVGKSVDVSARLSSHLDSHGSEWTKLHRAIAIAETRPMTTPLDEDHITKQMMMKFGIDKVRGGSYSSVNLSAAQLKSLEMEFRGASDRCFECGESGHFVKACTRSKTSCARCGRQSHVAANCYAKTHKSGAPLADGSDWMVCVQCGGKGHGGLLYCPSKATWVWAKPAQIVTDATVGRCADCGGVTHGPLGTCPVAADKPSCVVM